MQIENKFDGTRNTSRTADQDDFMNVRLGIAKDLNRANTATEYILAELFETSTSKGSAGVDTLKESVDFEVAEESVHLPT